MAGRLIPAYSLHGRTRSGRSLRPKVLRAGSGAMATDIAAYRSEIPARDLGAGIVSFVIIGGKGISHQLIVRLPAMRGLLQHCGLFRNRLLSRPSTPRGRYDGGRRRKPAPPKAPTLWIPAPHPISWCGPKTRGFPECPSGPACYRLTVRSSSHDFLAGAHSAQPGGLGAALGGRIAPRRGRLTALVTEVTASAGRRPHH